jgi:O-antigen ligase
VFLQHPLIGVGRGVYAKYFATPAVYRLGVRQIHNYPSHNLYLNMAAESGIIGFGLFMAIIVAVGKSLYRQYKLLFPFNPVLADLAACFFLGLCAYLFSGLFLHLGYERYFWMQLALCSAAARIIIDTVPIARGIGYEVTTSFASRDLRVQVSGS